MSEKMKRPGGKLGDIIGDFSERRVLEALSELTEVQRVVMMKKHASDLDIKVELAKYLGIDEIQIQVKSSASGIAHGRDKLSKRLGIAPTELHDWLLRNRFVFLNGAKYNEQIQDDFLYYLRQIEAHINEENSKKDQ